uniref:Aspartic-type endopeptidase/ pepsin A n=1 Tax=Zea mays TaxID=4577 RepID=B6SVD7_MAIZE|nr:aspartic-type endopeptidase/ pepsin A [Zea mays]|eukprot:NP_001147826.1 aspartic-type endopeptidase/ pepsin A [Zea mays]
MAHARYSHRRTGLLLAVAVAVVVVASLVAAADASSFGFDLHHRFSPVVRRWAEARGGPLAADRWPARGTPEYYSALSRHDRARRALAGGADDGLLTFAAGNDTYQSGTLYYAEVELGTPNATFLVALDTGSDLFWVPCDCRQCATIPSANATGPDAPPLRPYSPRRSSTSEQVACDNPLCGRRNGCSAATNGSCPYEVQYVSANTSSSGVLVQDVLHLTRERPGPGAAGEALQAPVVFGCGQVQTGAFLDDGGGAVDGLMGLGMGKVSVPSALAASGLVASDSFSMCFGDDGVGRVNFGDAGSRGQAETPFTVRSLNPTYNVSFTSIGIGSESVAAEFAAVMDSGTSFTYLSDPEYTQLATKFNSQVSERRVNFSSGSADPFPFEYCYRLSPNQTEVAMPDVSLTAKGGALFPVTQPFIPVGDTTGRAIGYCLAIMRNDMAIGIDIIGQNFMTGLKVVFDRERSVLGWEKFDCYRNARVADAPDGSPGPSSAPAAGPTKITPRQNDGSGSGYPGAAPLPRSAGSRNAAAALGLGCLYLLLAAALV